MAPEWSFLHLVELCAPVSQTLQASVSHVTLISWYYLFIFNDMMLSLRQAVNMPFKAMLHSLLCMSFLLCSWRLLEAACVTKRQTTIFMFCSCVLLVCIVVIATSKLCIMAEVCLFFPSCVKLAAQCFIEHTQHRKYERAQCV